MKVRATRNACRHFLEQFTLTEQPLRVTHATAAWIAGIVAAINAVLCVVAVSRGDAWSTLFTGVFTGIGIVGCIVNGRRAQA